jgi:hypothetical protein
MLCCFTRGMHLSVSILRIVLSFAFYSFFIFAQGTCSYTFTHKISYLGLSFLLKISFLSELHALLPLTKLICDEHITLMSYFYLTTFKELLYH